MHVKTFPVSGNIIKIPIDEFKKLVNQHMFRLSVKKSEVMIEENNLFPTELELMNDSDISAEIKEKADDSQKKPLSEFVNI